MLTILEVEKLAKLARIELSAEEKQRFALEISSILDYVDKLQKLKLADDFQEEASSENRFRPDKVVGVSTEEQQELINQAPESMDNLIKTKAVFK